ncbi:MAG: M20 family metallopeptidase, partial [Candidatus Accumulibacter sp.]|nr:M20 family metallopeptidase [Accumulibacter sp.]
MTASIPDPVELTQVLVRMNTVNHSSRADEAQAARYVEGLLKPAGFECRVVEFAPRRASLVARIGQADGPALAFTGHFDTVALGAADWSRDPFAAEIFDGKLYGRGSSDMKSGLAAFIVAALELADTLRAGPGLVLILTADEETGCRGALDVAGRPELRELLANVGALLVGEPTGNRPLAAHKGALWLCARAKGVTAHGSMPEHGENAIYKLAPALIALRDYKFPTPPHPLMGPPTLNVGLIRGGQNINSVPDAAEFTIDIRSVAGQDHAAVRGDIAAQLGPDIDLGTILDMQSIYTDPREPWMRYVTELCTPGKPPGSVAYFTDAAVLRSALGSPPTAILGPGEAHMSHQTDEYCPVENITRAKALYR